MGIFSFIKTLGDAVEFGSNFASLADTTGSIWDRAKKAFKKTTEKLPTLPSTIPPKHSYFTMVEKCQNPLGIAAFEGLFGLDDVIQDVMKHRWAVGDWKLTVGDWVEVCPGEEFSPGGVDHYKAGDLGQVVAVKTNDSGHPEVTVAWKRTGRRTRSGDSTGLFKQFKCLNFCRKTPFLIFSGPPGSGKTDVAVRTARAWGVPLLAVEAAHICGNNSERPTARLHELGAKIKAVGSCVVLFDEVDHFIAGDSLEGEAASVRSQFRQLVDGPDKSLKDCNVLFIGSTNQLHRIEEDMLSRAEVIHFRYPDKIAMQHVIQMGAPQLSLSDASSLAKDASRYHLGPRDVHECARFVVLHGKINELVQLPTDLYRRCYSKRYEDYRLLRRLPHIGNEEGTYVACLIGGFLAGALVQRFGHGRLTGLMWWRRGHKPGSGRTM